jgi:hypothetical protein
MDRELQRSKDNYLAAHRYKESIDLEAVAELVSVLEREVPRMTVALRLTSRNPIWMVIAQGISDMILIAKQAERMAIFQWQAALINENFWRKAFLKARDDIEARIVTDQDTLQALDPVYQMALEDATSSEGESLDLELPIMEFDTEDDEEDLVDPVDIIEDDV